MHVRLYGILEAIMFKRMLFLLGVCALVPFRVSGAIDEIMVDDGSGNAVPDATAVITGAKMGIGTSSPDALLDVAGLLKTERLQIADGTMTVRSSLGVWTLAADEGNLAAVLDSDNNYINSDGALIELPPGRIELENTLYIPYGIEIRGVANGVTELYMTNLTEDVIRLISINDTNRNAGNSAAPSPITNRGDLCILRNLTISREVDNLSTASLTGSGIDTFGANAPFILLTAITNQRCGIYNSRPDAVAGNYDAVHYTANLNLRESVIVNVKEAFIKWDSPKPGPKPWWSNNGVYATNMVFAKSLGDGIVTATQMRSEEGEQGIYLTGTIIVECAGVGLIARGNNFFLDDFYVHRTGSHGIRLDHCRRFNMTGSSVANAGMTVSGDKTRFVSASGIHIENDHSDFPDDWDVIYADSSTINYNADINITNSLITMNGGNGISIIGADATSGTPNPTPIEAQNIRVADSNIHSNGLAQKWETLSDADRCGILIKEQVHHLMITGNRIYNDDIAVKKFKNTWILPGTTGWLSGTVPTPNQLYGIYAPPNQLTGSTQVKCNGLMITGNNLFDDYDLDNVAGPPFVTQTSVLNYIGINSSPNPARNTGKEYNMPAITN